MCHLPRAMTLTYGSDGQDATVEAPGRWLRIGYGGFFHISRALCRQCSGKAAESHDRCDGVIQLAVRILSILAHLGQLAAGNERQLSIRGGTATTGGEERLL
jgi:hypothetical protein